MTTPTQTPPPESATANPVAKFLEVANIITIVVILVTIGGLLVVLVQPSTLTFHQYLHEMKWVWGLTAIGRGTASMGRIG